MLLPQPEAFVHGQGFMIGKTSQQAPFGRRVLRLSAVAPESAVDTRPLQTDANGWLETRTDQPAGEEHRAARAVGVLPSEEHRLVHRLVRGVRVDLRQQRNLVAARAPSSKR